MRDINSHVSSQRDFEVETAHTSVIKILKIVVQLTSLPRMWLKEMVIHSDPCEVCIIVLFIRGDMGKQRLHKGSLVNCYSVMKQDALQLFK